VSSDRPIWGRSRAPRAPRSDRGIGADRPTVPRASPHAPPPSPPQPSRPAADRVGPSRNVSTRTSATSRSRRVSLSRLPIAIGAAVVVVVVGGVVLLPSRDSSPADEEKIAINTPTSVNTSAPGNTSPPNSSTIPPNSEWDSIARSVVYIEAVGSRCGWTGSGSIVGDGSFVLTNQHVSGDGECDLTVWLTDSTSSAPTKYLRAKVIEANEALDLAIIQMIDSDGQPFIDASREPMKFSSTLPKLGDKLTILGYPGIGGSTITLTSGDFSGVDKSESYDYLKTTANMNPGVSGGAAFNAKGELVGIPTAGRGAEIACDSRSDCVANGSTIGLLRPVGLAEDLLSRINR